MKTLSIRPFSAGVRRVAPCLVTVGGIAILVGCGAPTSHVVTAPPPPPPTQIVVTQPQTVTTTTAMPTPTGPIVVTQAPPTSPPQTQVVVTRPAQPSSDHVWLEGYWTWRDNRYEWVTGHWAERPNAGAVWVPPSWERRSDGNYVFHEGYWR